MGLTNVLNGQQLKTIGQQQALFGAGDLWLGHAKREFRAWISALYKAGRREFRMEEFRAYCERIDLMPESPNAWGIFPSLFVKSGLIASTGRYEKASSPRTRAHPVQIWRIV